MYWEMPMRIWCGRVYEYYGTHEDGNEADMYIPYPIKRVRNSSYSYPYIVNAKIFHQNEDRFEQYHRGEFICHS